ncbi:hypothetical protein EJD97_004608, partial [Solanum chilense]
FVLKEASDDNKNFLRKSSMKDQLLEYFSTRKFDAHGRFMILLSLRGVDNVVIILLEVFNSGWKDIDLKIGNFINYSQPRTLNAPYLI